MECAKCLELLSELIDGALALSERMLLTSHFSQCFPCADTHRDIELIVKIARELRDAHAAHIPQSLRPDIFSASIREAAAAAHRS